MKALYTNEEFNTAKRCDLLTLQCKKCNKSFQRPKYMVERYLYQSTQPIPNVRGDYCSKSCHQSSRGEGFIETKCDNCSKPIIKRVVHYKRHPTHFCNHSCATTYLMKHKIKGTNSSKLERWLETELSQRYNSLKFSFRDVTAIEAELDIYIPQFKLAFELNGAFHYEQIFSEKEFNRTQNKDKMKMLACAEKGISLCVLDVSGMRNFTIKKALTYLSIITNIIDQRAKDLFCYQI